MITLKMRNWRDEHITHFAETLDYGMHILAKKNNCWEQETADCRKCKDKFYCDDLLSAREHCYNVIEKRNNTLERKK